MKPHLKFPCTILATALAAALQLAAIAAVPVAWTNSPGMPPYPIKPVPHGSTVDLAVTLKGYTTPPIADGADVRLWYQTNGMGSAWWSAPATFDGSTITASFGPAQDCGADRVSLFFGAPSNVFASAVLRLTHAPGFAPNAIETPVTVLDFAGVEIANAPYYTKSETDSKIVELAPAPGNYSVVSNAAVNAAPKYKSKFNCQWVYYDSIRHLLSGGEPWGDAIATWGHSHLPRLSSCSLEYLGAGVWRFRTGSATPYPDYKVVTNSEDAVVLDFGGNYLLTKTNEVQSAVVYSDELHPAISNVVTKSYVEDLGITSEESDPVWSADKPNYATKTELGGVSETANAAALDAASALRIVLGESVWFAVTNYMRTAEGVIPSLQLWEVRDSVTNLVYDSREEITNTVKALTRELHTELTNRIHDVEKTIPSKAWGNYQSDGTDNPQPGEVAILNPPTVILTGGGTFNKYIEVGDSSVWVLQSSGPVSFGGNTNGNFFAIHDDEGNYSFRVAKTDSYDLPAFISGILPRQSQNLILIYTATTNRHGNAVSEHPTISVCSDLKESVWHEEVDGEIDALGITVSWAKDETIPAWVATVTPDNYPPNLYFRCKVVQEGGVAVINTAPTRFDGGVQFGNETYRLVPYTTGGKTYLTLEH